jgi:hypothetical protein
VQCGKSNIPGVYASTASGLCFIDWATKCISGTDFYNLDQCSNWAEDERRFLKSEVRRWAHVA